MQLKLLTLLYNMRYDKIKVGPCGINNINIAIGSLNKGSTGTCSLKDNNHVTRMLVNEIEKLDSGYRYSMDGILPDYKCTLWEFPGDIDVATQTGTGELKYSKLSEAVVLYDKFEACGSYTFYGIEVMSVDTESSLRTLSFEEVEVSLDTDIMAGETKLVLL